jgi:urea transporter
MARPLAAEPGWACALLNAFSQVLLQRSPLCGLCCLLAILLGAPQVFAQAVLGAGSGLWVAHRRGYSRCHWQQGLYGYNGVLIGLLLGHWLPADPLQPLLVVLGGGLGAMLVEHWRRRCPRPTCLPAYTLPFVLAGWAVALVVQAPTPASVAPTGWLAAVLGGVGQIFMLGQPLAGALVLLGLLLADRRAACWALIGSACGVYFGLFQGLGLANGLGGLNPALAALAFCHSRWLPGVAIALAVLLEPGFSQLPIPALTAPFILACWLIKAASRLWAQARQEAAPLRSHGHYS